MQCFSFFSFFIGFWFPPFFSPNLVANCTPSVPITNIAVDTPQRPRRSAAREIQDIRQRCAFHKPQASCDCGSKTSVSRAILDTAINSPCWVPPPLPRSGLSPWAGQTHHTAGIPFLCKVKDANATLLCVVLLSQSLPHFPSCKIQNICIPTQSNACHIW